MDSSTTNKNSTITVIAWLGMFIAGYGIYVYGSYLFFYIYLANDFYSEDYADQFTGYVKFVLENNDFLVYPSCILALTAFIAAIGLLKRKNWARILLVACIIIQMGLIINGSAFNYLLKQQIEQLRANMTSDRKSYNTESVAEIVERTISMTEIDMGKSIEKGNVRTGKADKKLHEIKMKQQSVVRIAYLVEIVFHIVFLIFLSWVAWKLTRPNVITECNQS